MNQIIVLFGKTLSAFSQMFNLGNGSTWPGHIALQINKHFVRDILKNSATKIILVAGTNGKTTTSLLIKTILETNGKTVIHNSSGANLINGIASTLLLNANLIGKVRAEYAIFEVDENSLTKVLAEIDPQYILLLNLFRDQLDRYGEVATIAKKWTDAILHEEHINLILNADDPQIAFIGQQLFNQKLVKYFGLNAQGKKEFDHAVDSIYCPRCGTKLDYADIYYSHLGNWSCPKCHLKRPQLSQEAAPFYPLPGQYNEYNTFAATLVAKELGLSEGQIKHGLQQFKPAFGRQEIVEYQGKKMQLFLSKNPTGFNESLRTIKELKATNILIALNDRIADGRDVSWIWDIDTEMLGEFAKHITVTGDRAYDMGLRIKYSGIPNSTFQTSTNLKSAISESINKLSDEETLYILPTYTAMLELRKILSGKKIL